MSFLLPSKRDIIRSLKGQKILDIGGTGYASDPDLRPVWQGIDRVVLDFAEGADWRVDLNGELPPFPSGFDAAAAFDVLEHLDRPVDVLRWIAAPRLFVNMPLGTSIISNWLEGRCYRQQPGFYHLYTFKPVNLISLVERGGWRVRRVFYTYDMPSIVGQAARLAASFCPPLLAMGVACEAVREK